MQGSRRIGHRRPQRLQSLDLLPLRCVAAPPMHGALDDPVGALQRLFQGRHVFQVDGARPPVARYVDSAHDPGHGLADLALEQDGRRFGEQIDERLAADVRERPQRDGGTAGIRDLRNEANDASIVQSLSLWIAASVPRPRRTIQWGRPGSANAKV
jgi:hypothetical protein